MKDRAKNPRQRIEDGYESGLFVARGFWNLAGHIGFEYTISALAPNQLYRMAFGHAAFTPGNNSNPKAERDLKTELIGAESFGNWESDQPIDRVSMDANNGLFTGSFQVFAL